MKKKAPCGCLGFIGDQTLPSYMGIIIYHLKGSLLNNQDSMESKAVFFSWLTSIFLVGTFHPHPQAPTKKHQPDKDLSCSWGGLAGIIKCHLFWGKSNLMQKSMLNFKGFRLEIVHEVWVGVSFGMTALKLVMVIPALMAGILIMAS